MGFMFQVGERVEALGKVGSITEVVRTPNDLNPDHIETSYRVHTDEGRDLLLPGMQIERVQSPSAPTNRYSIELTIETSLDIDPDELRNWAQGSIRVGSDLVPDVIKIVASGAARIPDVSAQDEGRF